MSLARRSDLSDAQRAALAYAFGEKRTAAAEPILLGWIDGADDATRAALYPALASCGTAASAKALEAAARAVDYGCDETAATDSYLRLLDRMVDEGAARDAVKAAKRLLKCERANVRGAALEVIVRAEGTRAMPYVLAALEKGDIQYRNAALRYIGDKADDPVFTISDLLIHLSSEQMSKPAKDAVDAEILDVIVGGRPVKFDEDDKDAPKEPVKQMFLDILKEQYGVEEEDFLSAEIEVVPAGPARDMGLDRSMILGYGHDDRVCAYPSMLAQIDVANVERTSITLIVDKEEIGSVGATGMTSRFFENTVAEIMTLAGEDSPLALRRALARSRMLSSDVSAGFDPGYAGKFETKNAAFMGRGLCFNKYTGSRGKGGSNDADAEYVALVRDIMDEAGVDFQTCELGRVNAGGGGTIAYIMAKYGMNVIDSGVAVLSMHALWEVANKADIYEAYRGYKAFLERA